MMKHDNKSDNIKVVPLNIKCPVCYKNTLNLIYTITNIPYFGELLVMGIKCQNCGFKVSDVMLVTHKGKTIIQEKITKDTINDLVVLSADSTVSIPELGVEIDIRTESGGEITTIEGILREFLDYIKQLSNSDLSEQETKLVNEIAEKIKKELDNPTGLLTIEIKDETGKSSIVPHKLWSQRAEKERASSIELEKLKKIAEEKIEKLKTQSHTD